MDELEYDIVVVGAGPGGSSASYWLAAAGLRVAVLEKAAFPRDKTCGDGLTPRSVRQIQEMGAGHVLAGAKEVHGPRYIAPYAVLDVAWPSHPDLPSTGYVVRRSVLDERLAQHAVGAGAELFERHEVVGIEAVDGAVTGIVARTPSGAERRFRARRYVLAAGSKAPVLRTLGHHRDRAYPLGVAIRGYVDTEADDEWLDSFLDLRLLGHRTIPGYGWAFPTGDGTLNVGVGILSTYSRWKELNTTDLLDAFLTECVQPRWPFDPATLRDVHGGMLPLGGSIDPIVGANYVLIGDAAAVINPFNGEGISYALESGRLAAAVLVQVDADGSSVDAYRALLVEQLGSYYRAGMMMLNVVGRPAVLREMMRLGMQSQSLMEWATRILCNLPRQGVKLKPGELALRMLERGAARGRAGARPMKAALATAPQPPTALPDRRVVEGASR